jgi:hypothetical protein
MNQINVKIDEDSNSLKKRGIAMFPSVLVEPQLPFVSYALVSFGLIFGFYLRAFKRGLTMIAIGGILFLPQATFSMMGGPGVCGTSCMMMWGRPSYPSVYYGNFNVNPWSFYASPISYYRMLPSWSMAYSGPYARTIQSVDVPKESPAGK